MQCDIAIVGVGVMGRNLALNVESKGFRVCVFDKQPEKAVEFATGPAAAGKNISAAKTHEELVGMLSKPRKMLLMVNAGPPVDDALSRLKPFLERGDIVIDGGNSHFRDTERRQKELEPSGIALIGCGVSGGEAGALRGPCIMPGGPEEAYRNIEHILTKMAAQVEGAPCCAYIGPRGAGHYVKMVHNGIEYGLMQLIAEAYALLSGPCRMKPKAISEVVGEWASGDFGGYLLEITSHILASTDPETGRPIVDVILDKAGQKGTGKWTSQDALDVGSPIPTIDAAVSARVLSAYKAERTAASKVLTGPARKVRTANLRKDLGAALKASMISCYAQGMALLRTGSAEYGYGLKLAEIARIWRGGCIIRSKLLQPIAEAFESNRDLPNLLVAPYFSEAMKVLQTPWRNVVSSAAQLGVSVPAMMSALAYYDGYRSERLPANLTQAQRDYFGAHTYERTDRAGTFHTDWEALVKAANPAEGQSQKTTR